MFRRDGFLERIHDVLSRPGADAARVESVLDECLAAYGASIPANVVVSVQDIRDALFGGGILSARRLVAALLRQGTFAAHPSGVFTRPFSDAQVGDWSALPADAGHRFFTLYEADDGKLQLTSGEGANEAKVGEPRHFPIVHLALQKKEISLAEAIAVSGTVAVRKTQVFYEIRDWMGHEWWDESDGPGPTALRMLRLREPPGGKIVRRRVRALRVVEKIGKWRAR
jgi:hypothetical protein